MGKNAAVNQEIMFSQYVKEQDGASLINLLENDFDFTGCEYLEEDIDAFVKGGLSFFPGDAERLKIAKLYLDIDEACYDQQLYRYALRVNEAGLNLLENLLMDDASNTEVLSYKARAFVQKANSLDSLLKFDENISLANEALKIEQDLCDKYPENIGYRLDLINTYKYLGDSSFDVDVNPFYQKQFDIAQRLYEKFPDHLDVKYVYSIAVERRGTRLRLSGDFVGAMGLFEEYLALQEELLAVDSEVSKYMNGAAIANSRIGRLYENMGKFTKALSFFSRDRLLLEKLHDMHPRRMKYWNNLAWSYRDIAGVYINERKFEEAIEMVKLCIVEREKIKDVSDSPFGHLQNYYHDFETLGYIYWKMADHEQSEKYFEKYLEQVKEALEKFPDRNSIKSDLGRAYQHMGGVCSGKEDEEAALTNFQKFHEQAKELFIENKAHEGYRNNYAFALGKMANTHVALGDFSKAIELYLEELVLREDLLKLRPKDFDYMQNCTVCIYSMANAQLLNKQYTEAKENFEKCKTMFQELDTVSDQDLYTEIIEQIGFSINRMEIQSMNPEDLEDSNSYGRESHERKLADVKEDEDYVEEMIMERDARNDSLSKQHFTAEIIESLEEVYDTYEDFGEEEKCEEISHRLLAERQHMLSLENTDYHSLKEVSMSCYYEYRNYVGENDKLAKANLELAISTNRYIMDVIGRKHVITEIERWEELLKNMNEED